jgi:hypothetical protein
MTWRWVSNPRFFIFGLDHDEKIGHSVLMLKTILVNVDSDLAEILNILLEERETSTEVEAELEYNLFQDSFDHEFGTHVYPVEVEWVGLKVGGKDILDYISLEELNKIEKKYGLAKG